MDIIVAANLGSLASCFQTQGTVSSRNTTVSSRPNGKRSSASRGVGQRKIRLPNGRNVACKATGIFYSTVGGNTETAAEWVKDLMPGDSELLSVDDSKPEDMVKYDALIVGAPTWNTGADDCRSGTAWDEILDDIAELDMSGKPVAVFGLGDSASYSDNFCDTIEELHDTFAKAGAKMCGYVAADKYDYNDTKSVRDGKFLGLPLDADNEDDMTEERVKVWTQQLAGEMGISA